MPLAASSVGDAGAGASRAPRATDRPGASIPLIHVAGAGAERPDAVRIPGESRLHPNERARRIRADAIDLTPFTR